MSFKRDTCYYREGGLAQQRLWLSVQRTRQFLQSIEIGRDYGGVVWIQCPRRAQDLLILESSQIHQP